MTRRFDIGPLALALGAIVLLVGLFLNWFGDLSAWQVFELTDVVLAALGVAGLVAAVGLMTPDGGYIDAGAVPWISGAALVIVAAELLSPPPGSGGQPIGTGAWLSFGAAVVMVLGTLLTFEKVSFAVAFEGRDRRRRVSAVDHRPPPTEAGAPVPAPADRAPRANESLLRPRQDDEPARAPESLLNPRTGDEGGEAEES